MNIVIPMAGEGSRFKAHGYGIPKPLLPIKGHTMVEHVLENIAIPSARYYLIVRAGLVGGIAETQLPSREDLALVVIDGPTQGAACTVLRAKQFIDNGAPLLIANADQYVYYDRAKWGSTMANHDAAMMIFRAGDPKWSYAELDDAGHVIRVAEKQVISEWATVGVYYWSRGDMFVRHAEQMIAKGIRTNSEFYVCPVFNEAIANGIEVGTLAVQMYGMGTPEDLEKNYSHIGS